MRIAARLITLTFVFALGALQFASADDPAPQSNAQPGQQSLSQIISKVKSQCASDISKFCADVTPGQGRINDCLSAREDKLSSQCTDARASAKNDIERRMDKAQVAFRQSCGSDVQKFCPNTPYGQGRVESCLNNNKAQLSGSCQQFQAKLEQKLAEVSG